MNKELIRLLKNQKDLADNYAKMLLDLKHDYNYVFSKRRDKKAFDRVYDLVLERKKYWNERYRNVIIEAMVENIEKTSELQRVLERDKDTQEELYEWAKEHGYFRRTHNGK